ncbi:Eukaryotic aspartyl protease [Aspergillus sclerotialis]|uniref:Eukaryotic aspartyl protease n=1 Tax=Aspergillus sclerotialis TaxID=2070753 RepID=A0A3A2ZQ78_9EURO|nr:Eukaryotic aspartyl protease [Aspergillus sclerotialis]
MASRINLIPNPNYRKSGTKSYLHAMRKYRFHPTKDGPYFFGPAVQQTGRVFTEKAVGGRARVRQVMCKKLADGQVGKVPAEDIQNDTEYLAPVAIGTQQAQTLKLDFDSGSADLWVWSTELPASTLSQSDGHTVFNPSKSSTFKSSQSASWQIVYGDGSSASGNVGTDNIDIGGITVTGQSVELAKHLSSAFVENAGDGLLGLAFSNINTVRPFPVKTPVDNMIAQRKIPTNSQLFTAKLSSSRDNNDPSFYTFGFIDEDTVKATGQEITYARVNNMMGLWMFDSTTASVNGKTIDRFWNSAIADTGTTLALVDDAMCHDIYNAIPGAKYDSDSQGYIFPSDTPTNKLPTVEFAVGHKMFMVRKEDLAFSEVKPGFVYGGIQSRGTMGFDILGDTFLKGIYAIFDVGNTRFGAVQRKKAE